MRGDPHFACPVAEHGIAKAKAAGWLGCVRIAAFGVPYHSLERQLDAGNGVFVRKLLALGRWLGVGCHKVTGSAKEEVLGIKYSIVILTTTNSSSGIKMPLD